MVPTPGRDLLTFATSARPRVGLPTAATGGAAATIPGDPLWRCIGHAPRDERGQILVVFVLSMVAIIGVVGLAIDGGGAYAQRRDQQTAADLAALAGANDYLLSNNATQATTRARTIAATNNFTNGSARPSVDVVIDTTNGVSVAVTIQSPHRNSFLGRARDDELGRHDHAPPRWPASPTRAGGAGPFIFSIGAFNDDGTPKYQTATDFGETQRRRPDQRARHRLDELRHRQRQHVRGRRHHRRRRASINETLDYGEYIGQHNNGNHTALYGDVDTYLSGKEMPVAIVDASGNFMGWAMFHVNSASGGSNKHINGYFLSSFASAQTDGRRLREQRLPALPRLVRPEAHELGGRSPHAVGRRFSGARPRRRDRARASADRAGRVDDARGRPGGGARRSPPGRRSAASASSGVAPRSTSRSRWTYRIAGHEPDLVADLGEAALDELDRLDHDGRRPGRLAPRRSSSRIRGRTTGWTIASSWAR